MIDRFDSRAAGTPERAWTSGWLPDLAPLEAPARDDHLVVVAAHPDDETLGAGGLIAAAAALGASITVLIASDGEASHPQSPTHSPADLAKVRRTEVRAALSVLHPDAALHFLGLPDSQLADYQDELVVDIAQYADAATHLITPWSGDRHPDHAACALAGAEVARVAGINHWQFPIWLWHWGNPESASELRPSMRQFRLDRTAVAAKQRAIRQHRSQHAALSAAPGDEAILTEEMLAHFDRSYEVFVVAAPAAATTEYFDDLYAHNDDPWGLRDRFYERRKRQLVLASLPRERFRRVFEPGCAIGLLTTALAQRCDELIAWDTAQAALDQTSTRIAELTPAAAVTVELGQIPSSWPNGEFDLIVLSEVGYYCEDLGQLQRRIQCSLAVDGVLLACHWRHPATEHPVTAAALHTAIGTGLNRIAAHYEADFLLDVWTRDGRSVAIEQGIVG